MLTKWKVVAFFEAKGMIYFSPKSYEFGGSVPLLHSLRGHHCILSHRTESLCSQIEVFEKGSKRGKYERLKLTEAIMKRSKELNFIQRKR